MLLIRTNSGVSVAALAWVLRPLGRPGPRLVGMGAAFSRPLSPSGRFLRGAAHDLLNPDGERTSFLEADQREGEEGQPGYHLAVQTGKEPLQAIGVLPGFGDHDFITSQQVNIPWPVDMLTKNTQNSIAQGSAWANKRWTVR